MTDGPTAPDACLVAAAPDLLDALRLAVSYVKMIPAVGRFESDARRLVLTRAHEVIRQATGETE